MVKSSQIKANKQHQNYSIGSEYMNILPGNTLYSRVILENDSGITKNQNTATVL